jgi:uncharacterized protein
MLNLNGKINAGDFKDIAAGNIEEIRQFCLKYPYDTCDYNIVNLFSWGHFLNCRGLIYKDRLLIYNFSSDIMLFPMGKPISPVDLAGISEESVRGGLSGNFILAPESFAVNNSELSRFFDVVPDPCNSDYIYLSEKLSELSGKKLQKKKNLISQFRRTYGEYRTELFKDEYFGLCKDLAYKWCRDHNEICDDGKKMELNVLERAIKDHSLLGLGGLLIFVGGEVIAYSLFSEQRPDMATIHFEKFDFGYKGSAQLINRETAAYLTGSYKFINREQDMCLEGLKRSKLSYDPEYQVQTYKLMRKKNI